MASSHLMVVLIVAMALLASVLRARYLGGRRTKRHSLASGNPENDRLRDEVKQLKERLAVLERITVDKENSLERQIEELRDR
jgi:uncharacterized protein YlxW (UPF0749 family)